MNPITPTNVADCAAIARRSDQLKQSGQRSHPGEGNAVKLYLNDPTCPADACELDKACHGLVEDFANCGWPVAVKIRTDIEQTYVVTALREIADCIERDTDWENFDPMPYAVFNPLTVEKGGKNDTPF